MYNLNKIRTIANPGFPGCRPQENPSTEDTLTDHGYLRSNRDKAALSSAVYRRLFVRTKLSNCLDKFDGANNTFLARQRSKEMPRKTFQKCIRESHLVMLTHFGPGLTLQRCVSLCIRHDYRGTRRRDVLPCHATSESDEYSLWHGDRLAQDDEVGRNYQVMLQSRCYSPKSRIKTLKRADIPLVSS